MASRAEAPPEGGGRWYQVTAPQSVFWKYIRREVCRPEVGWVKLEFPGGRQQRFKLQSVTWSAAPGVAVPRRKKRRRYGRPPRRQAPAGVRGSRPTASKRPRHEPDSETVAIEVETEDEEPTGDGTPEDSRAWEDSSYDRDSVETQETCRIDDALEQAVARCEAAYAELRRLMRSEELESRRLPSNMTRRLAAMWIGETPREGQEDE